MAMSESRKQIRVGIHGLLREREGYDPFKKKSTIKNKSARASLARFIKVYRQKKGSKAARQYLKSEGVKKRAPISWHDDPRMTP